MTYQEYKKVRQIQIHDLVSSKLVQLTDPTMKQTVLDDALMEYEQNVHHRISELYQQTALSPEPYELEIFIPKIKDKKVKHNISTLFFDLNLLFETVYDMTQDEDPEREHDSLEECLEKISPDQRKEATHILQKYIDEYNESPTYIGSGETCTAFQIGKKVIKFGAKRRYPNIPYCLSIEQELEYQKNHFMYITDKIETGDISEIETEAMYRTLRDQGYVWVDVKPDNIGRMKGHLKILDDVDIYTEEDALSEHHKSTILDFVSYNIDLALLEIRYLKSKNPSFTINDIDEYFENQSTQTKEKIDRIKEHYISRTKSYAFDPNAQYYQTFAAILENRIAEQNSDTTKNNNQKRGTLQ